MFGDQKVLVTGAGGPAGVAVIRELVALGYEVVAADADVLAVGMRLVPEYVVLPAADHPEFLAAVCRCGDRLGCTVIISTVAEEISVLGPHSECLDRSGIRALLPSPEATLDCVDKWRFHQRAIGSGLPVPATARDVDDIDQVPGPWVVKPRFGRGSRHTYHVDDPDEVPWIARRVPDPLLQTRLVGREFTVDALVDRTFEVAGAVPRWRLEVRGGISVKGTTFADPAVVELVTRVSAAIACVGPISCQGFVDEGGEPWLTEVNPRFSGGLPLSLAAGAGLVEEYLRMILADGPCPERLRFRPGVTMLRYFEECFEE